MGPARDDRQLQQPRERRFDDRLIGVDQYRQIGRDRRIAFERPHYAHHIRSP
jgi:hypothetical protein